VAGRVFVVMRMLVIMRVRVMMVLVVLVMRVLVRCVGVMAADEYAGLARGDAAAVYGIKDKGCAEVERRGGLLKQCRRDAGVDQGAEQHVSAEAGEAFEITNAHDDSF
jgi:hypothetical protein